MKETKAKSTNKTKMTAVIALLLVCLLAVGGTIAYLTTHSKLSNTFTVGDIATIDPEEPAPSPDPDNPIDKDPTKLNGNLYEPHWVNNSKLSPGATVSKEPYVGVGAGSEACDVYVYVTNEMANNNMMYFEMNAGWSVVEANAVQVGGQTYYTGGLFKYDAGLDASKLSKENHENAWTTKALFDNVIVSEDANIADFKVLEGASGRTITVQAFLHQSKDAQGQDIADDVIVAAAKKAFGITQ
jgi:predicted ribosomally synthesized peptide with SipW-like signal peptide